MSSANEHSDRRLLLSNIITPNTGRKTGERGREGMLTGRRRERMTYCKKKKNWTRWDNVPRERSYSSACCTVGFFFFGEPADESFV